jgi:hypothetical protein
VPCSLDLGNVSGSSQLITWSNGFLAVVHEAYVDDYARRHYVHRFAHFDRDLNLQRLSLPFHFDARQIEFCAGLSWHGDRTNLLISYGVRDEEAKIAYVPSVEVYRMLWGTE